MTSLMKKSSSQDGSLLKLFKKKTESTDDVTILSTEDGNDSTSPNEDQLIYKTGQTEQGLEEVSVVSSDETAGADSSVPAVKLNPLQMLMASGRQKGVWKESAVGSDRDVPSSADRVDEPLTVAGSGEECVGMARLANSDRRLAEISGAAKQPNLVKLFPIFGKCQSKSVVTSPVTVPLVSMPDSGHDEDSEIEVSNTVQPSKSSRHRSKRENPLERRNSEEIVVDAVSDVTAEEYSNHSPAKRRHKKTGKVKKQCISDDVESNSIINSRTSPRAVKSAAGVEHRDRMVRRRLKADIDAVTPEKKTDVKSRSALESPSVSMSANKQERKTEVPRRRRRPSSRNSDSDFTPGRKRTSRKKSPDFETVAITSESSEEECNRNVIKKTKVRPVPKDQSSEGNPSKQASIVAFFPKKPVVSSKRRKQSVISDDRSKSKVVDESKSAHKSDIRKTSVGSNSERRVEHSEKGDLSDGYKGSRKSESKYRLDKSKSDSKSERKYKLDKSKSDSKSERKYKLDKSKSDSKSERKYKLDKSKSDSKSELKYKLDKSKSDSKSERKYKLDTSKSDSKSKDIHKDSTGSKSKKRDSTRDTPRRSCLSGKSPSRGTSENPSSSRRKGSSPAAAVDSPVGSRRSSRISERRSRHVSEEEAAASPSAAGKRRSSKNSAIRSSVPSPSSKKIKSKTSSSSKRARVSSSDDDITVVSPTASTHKSRASAVDAFAMMRRASKSDPGKDVRKPVSPNSIARKQFLASGIPERLAQQAEIVRELDNSVMSAFPAIGHVQQANTSDWVWNCQPPSAMMDGPSVSSRLRPDSPTLPGAFALSSCTLQDHPITAPHSAAPAVESADVMEALRRVLTGRAGDVTQHELWSSACALPGDEAVAMVTDWLADWRASDQYDDLSDETEQTGALLLVGPTGCGKTHAVYTAADKMGLKVLEVNTSCGRSGRQLSAQLSEATLSHKLHGRPALVLLEDMELVAEPQDEGFISSAAALVSSARRPVLMTAERQLPRRTAVRSVRHESRRLPELRPRQLLAHLMAVSVRQGYWLHPDRVWRLVSLEAGGDARRALLQLQLLCLGSCRERGQLVATRALLERLCGAGEVDDATVDQLPSVLVPIDDMALDLSTIRVAPKPQPSRRRIRAACSSDDERDDVATTVTLPRSPEPSIVPHTLSAAGSPSLEALSQCWDRLSAAASLRSSSGGANSWWRVSPRPDMADCEQPVLPHAEVAETRALQISNCVERLAFSTATSDIDGASFVDRFSEAGVDRRCTETVWGDYSRVVDESLPSHLLSRRSLVLDVLPSVRDICRRECVRSSTEGGRTRRFLHYLDHVGLHGVPADVRGVWTRWLV